MSHIYSSLLQHHAGSHNIPRSQPLTAQDSKDVKYEGNVAEAGGQRKLI